MAKEYKSKITLQDNYSAVMAKAIKQTQRLDKEFKKIEKLKINPQADVKVSQRSINAAKTDLKKLEKNKVKIGALLDSSFNSTMNTINKATAQNKKIKITAEETVSRTVKNLQRDIFTMERKLKTTLLGGGNIRGNFNMNAPGLTNALNSFKNLFKRNDNNNGGGGNIVSDIIANRVGTGAALSAAGITGAVVAANKGKSDGLVRIDANKATLNAKGLDMLGNRYGFKGGIGDLPLAFKSAMKEGLEQAKRIRDGKAEPFDGYRNVWNAGSPFDGLVNAQKDSMKALRNKLGLMNPYKLIEEQIDKSHPAPLSKMPNILKGGNSPLDKILGDIEKKYNNMVQTSDTRLKKVEKPYLNKYRNISGDNDENYLVRDSSNFGNKLITVMDAAKQKMAQFKSLMSDVAHATDFPSLFSDAKRDIGVASKYVGDLGRSLDLYLGDKMDKLIALSKKAGRNLKECFIDTKDGAKVLGLTISNKVVRGLYKATESVSVFAGSISTRLNPSIQKMKNYFGESNGIIAKTGRLVGTIGKGVAAGTRALVSMRRALKVIRGESSFTKVAFGDWAKPINKALRKLEPLRYSLKVARGEASFTKVAFGNWAKPLNTALRTMNNMARVSKTVLSNVGKIAAKGARMSLNIVGNALRTSAQILTNVTSAIAAAAGGLVFKGVMDGAMNEQYEVSMLHFIQNAGASGQDAINKRDDYMDFAINLANKTPFGTQEVLQAANRGMTASEGDVGLSKNLLQLSADMAALNPGKTIMDAMEALADLKMGETERMKEFGVKISQDDFVKAVGLDPKKISATEMSDAERLDAFSTLTNGKDSLVGSKFAGGAAKIADTFKGQFSTLTGQVGAIFADLGRAITVPFVEPLKKVNDKLGVFAGAMREVKDAAVGGEFKNWDEFIGWAIIDGGDNPIAQMARKMAPAVDLIRTVLNNAKMVLQSFFDMIQNSPALEGLKNAFNSIMGPVNHFFGSIALQAPWMQGLLDGFGTAAKVVLEFLGKAFESAYAIVQPILQWLGENSESVSKVLGGIGAIAGYACDLIVAAFNFLWPIVEPILTLMIDHLGWLGDIFMTTLPVAGEMFKDFGTSLGETIGGVVDWFTKLSKAITDALKKFGEWTGKTAGKVISGVGDFLGFNDANNNGRAVGQAYVPYNGYQASLHRGEAILTRQEADAWRSGRTSDGKVLSGASGGNQEITINVHGVADANEVAKKIAMELRRVSVNM